MRIAIAGASGLIGQALVKELTANSHQVVILSRDASPEHVASEVVSYACWDPYQEHIALDKLDGVDACVCLSGENIASGRWDEEKKKRLISSRVVTNDFLISSLSRLRHQPHTYFSASAVGIYHPSKEARIDESAPEGDAFISTICKKWEASSRKAAAHGMRSVQGRIGIVLSEHGGALKKMLPPFKLGLGGPLGSGRQYMSWIALTDAVRAIRFCLEKSEIQGPVNIVAPTPESNEAFSRKLAAALSRPCIFRVPAPLISLALGEMGDQLLLSSLPVVPGVLTRAGFTYQCADLETAFAEELTR